ncbi:hypothetical protein [Candidatus Nitrospira bockiana]
MNRTLTMTALAAAIAIPGLSLAEQKDPAAVVTPSTPGPVFPQSSKCTSFSPCTNIMGEVLKIEESYWIRDLNGREVHIKVTPESNMRELPKVGDKVTAQVDSTGDVQAIAKIDEFPKPPQVQMPSSTHQDLR